MKTNAKRPKTWLKLIGLFLGVFVGGFLAFTAYDVVLAAGQELLTPPPAAPGAMIDPQLEKNLAKVLEPTEVQDTADVKNPFADATGISDKTATSGGVTTTTSGAVAARSDAQPTRTVGAVREPASRTVLQNINGQTVESTTLSRLQLRDERIRLGEDGGPESLVFAVDDLLPVGTVDGGDGSAEVMFYSATACRVVSFPVGARFYDGWIDSIRPEGVVFAFYDRARTMRMRGWGRSVLANCGGTQQNTSANLLGAGE